MDNSKQGMETSKGRFLVYEAANGRLKYTGVPEAPNFCQPEL
jgi:hypothetical protein